MARLFASASSQYGAHGAAVITDVPLTMCCFYKPTSVGTAQVPMGIGQSNSNNNRFTLNVSAANPAAVGATTKVAGSTPNATTSGLLVAGTRYHLAAVFATASDRRVYVDGGNKVTNTQTLAMSTLNWTTIGRVPSNSVTNYADATIEEAAIWNVALTDDEILSLARGFSPLLIRPIALVAYWPLRGLLSPEPDLVGGFAMTLTATPTKADHGRIIQPYAA
jgi:hypothetical protein